MTDTQPEFSALQARFLDTFPRFGTIGGTAEAVGIHRTNHTRWMKNTPAYAEAFNRARDAMVDGLETEAIRRARDGVVKPVYQKGELVGEVREYSDHLLMFLLKANRPERFRDEVRVITESEIDAELRRLEAAIGAGHPAGEASPAR